MRDIESHQNANQSYIEEGIKLLQVAQRAHLLFENQPSAEKRKLLDFVLSNCTWKNGNLEAEYRKPFDLLAVAVAADQQAGVVEGGRTSKNENWLPGMDSSHELDRILKAHKLLIVKSRRCRQMRQKQVPGTKLVRNLFQSKSCRSVASLCLDLAGLGIGWFILSRFVNPVMMLRINDDGHHGGHGDRHGNGHDEVVVDVGRRRW